VVQWLRARFNECYEKAEWAKLRCAEELPFVERLLHDKARDMVGLVCSACCNASSNSCQCLDGVSM
jgi:serine/threonine-protein kinase ULK/ATG1